MPGNIQHNAPAGHKYSSIRDAGEQTLASHCQRFPQNPDRESFIVPALFKSEHPENVHQDIASLDKADKRLLTGLNINIRGERGEYEVYKVFYSLVRRSPTDSVLVIHGYGLDNDNGKNLKKHAIIKELPNIDLSNVRMKMEHDFVVIIRYIGIVLCEVKTSASAQNIASAESQLHNSDTFVKQIMMAIAGPTAPQLPTVKVIIVANEASSPSVPTKQNDCHVIYQDDLQNFTPKWTQIVSELKITAQSCFISPSSFEHFAQFLVGVWTMKCMTKNCYDFENASLSTDLADIDSSVSRAEFAPTKQGQKLTTDIGTSMNEMFQKVDQLNIMYLSPQQKSLYDNYKHALIHTHAGAGKTMLIVFKIIELLEADPTQNVLLVAPAPHHLRLQQIFSKHNITANIVTKFPYTTSIRNRVKRSIQRQRPPPVLIITLQNFFEVAPQKLMKYDISKFNIFVDDMHAHDVPRDETMCTFTEIGDFVDNCYNLLSTTDQYARFAFDAVQQGEYHGEHRRSDRLFETNDRSPRTFSIPVVAMTNVLRSTKEITNVIEGARQEQMRYNGLDTRDTNHILSDIGCGHHITTGTRVLYEKLEKDIKTEVEKILFPSIKTVQKHRIPFVCDRVCSLLHNLSTTASNNFRYSTVAILFLNEGSLQRYKPALQSVLTQQFNVGVQSIEQQLLSKNNDDVIIDHSENIQSFESPTVVYVRTMPMGGHSSQAVYNILSRARTLCVVVDVDHPPIPLQHVDVVTWKEVNETFEKV